MAEQEAEALAPEDADARRFATQDHSAEDDGTDPLSRILRNVFEGERAFQHLPLSWDRASPREVTALKNACKELGEQEIMGVALCACLSLSPESLPHLLLHASFDLAVLASTDGNWHLCFTSTGAVVAVHGVQKPDHSYRRKADSGYRPQSPATVVGLPWFVSKTLMAQARPEESEMLLRYFPDLAPNTRAAGELLRQRTGARLTFGRIQQVVANDLMSETQDECLVVRAIPTSSILVGSGIYYSAYPAIKLYRSHGRAVERALNWAVPPAAPELVRALRHAYVGSELTIDPRHLRAALDQLYQRAQASIRIGRYSSERIVEAFNCVAIYTLAVLCILTGHRPTNDPFPDPGDISSETCSAIICDKRQFGSNEQREVPLAKVAEAQFNAYLRTIHTISSYLDREFGDTAAKLRSLVVSTNFGFPSAALFSVLTLDAGKIIIRPFKRSDWRRMWPEWHWPENGTRHFLMQQLNAQGLPRELINYLFGHADPGQTAFNRHSSISPQQFIDSVEPMLSRIAEDLQIKTTGSPKAYGTLAIAAKPLMVKARLFGDADRAQQRRLSKSEKRFVRTLISELDRNKSETPFRVRSHISNMFNGDMILTTRVLRLLERCSRSSGT